MESTTRILTIQGSGRPSVLLEITRPERTGRQGDRPAETRASEPGLTQSRPEGLVGRVDGGKQEAVAKQE